MTSRLDGLCYRPLLNIDNSLGFICSRAACEKGEGEYGYYFVFHDAFIVPHRG